MGGNGGFGYDVRSPPGPGPHCAEDAGGITQASRPSLQIPREASSPQAPLRAHVAKFPVPAQWGSLPAGCGTQPGGLPRSASRRLRARFASAGPDSQVRPRGRAGGRAGGKWLCSASWQLVQVSKGCLALNLCSKNSVAMVQRVPLVGRKYTTVHLRELLKSRRKC